jgi:hypothetical protein
LATEVHSGGCKCDRCEGIKRHPEPSHCDWCGTTHRGDAANCPSSDTEPELEVEPETIEDEKLMWAVLGAIREITNKVKENTMIPKYTGGQQGTPVAGRGQQTAVRSGLPYLNQKNMVDYLELDIKYPVKIIEAKVNPANGNASPLVLKLAIKGKTVLWGIRTNNPSLEVLEQMFGSDENDWAGKSMQMWLHEDDFDGRIWPTVGPAEKEKKAKNS